MSVNGLTAWKERQRLEREYKLARLEELRRDAEVVERDGREYRLVRIPDRYGDHYERPEPPVVLRRVRKKR